MNLLDLLSQVQAITGGKYGLADLLSDDFVAEKTNFSSIADLLKVSPVDMNNMAAIQDLSESDLNDFVKEHSSYDTWKELLAEAVQFVEKNNA